MGTDVSLVISAFTFLLVFVLGKRSAHGPGGLLLHGEHCSSRYWRGPSASCGILRGLECNPGSRRCECALTGRMKWDPSAPKAAAPVTRNKNLRRLYEQDGDAGVKGACKFIYGERCTVDSDCFTGLSCLQELNGDDKICRTLGRDGGRWRGGSWVEGEEGYPEEPEKIHARPLPRKKTTGVSVVAHKTKTVIYAAYA